eukprot:138437-Rhodomonas_salina.2
MGELGEVRFGLQLHVHAPELSAPFGRARPLAERYHFAVSLVRGPQRLQGPSQPAPLSSSPDGDPLAKRPAQLPPPPALAQSALQPLQIPGLPRQLRPRRQRTHQQIPDGLTTDILEFARARSFLARGRGPLGKGRRRDCLLDHAAGR